MNKFILIFFILTSQSIYSANIFKQISISSQKAPYFFQLILIHLQMQPIETRDAQEILQHLIEINKNMGLLPLIDQKFFTTSEIYKSLLNFPFDIKTSTDTINSSDLKSLKKKLDRNKVTYSPFSQFIIESTYLDFKNWLKIEDFRSAPNMSPKEIFHLKKLLKYSGPWVNHINSYSPAQFNQLTTKVIINFLRTARIQLQAFPVYSRARKKPTPFLTGLSDIRIKNFLELKPDSSTLPISKEDESAINEVKDLQVDPIDKAQEDIDKFFKNNSL